MSTFVSKKVVKKYFTKKNSSHFINEIYWLKKLKNHKFTPKILNIDYKNLIISITYEGEQISNENKPFDWKNQLQSILKQLKKNNCFHSDIKPENLLVKKKKLKLIDFSQSMKFTDLKKNVFLKNRIFYDEYSINRINLSINKNIIISNDLRVLIVWEPNKQHEIEKKIKQNKKICIVDKIKIKKKFYINVSRDRVYWVDQFYNKKIGKNTNKLKKHIFVYIIKSINPIFKLNKMIFTNEYRIVDNSIFEFKKKIRNKKTSIIHISDNFEEAKRNAIFISRSKNDFPARYFFETQKIFKNKKDLFKILNSTKNLKYVVLRDQKYKNDDIDILTNNYYLFKRVTDCHSYKNKNLNFISNSGDPVEDNGFKVSNYIRIKDRNINIDLRFIGDGYFDSKWQKKILANRKFKRFYYTPNKNDYLFAVLYHIVYHKGYIDKKYFSLLKNNLKLKTLEFKTITKIVDKYLFEKKFVITRPSDLTIPVINKLDYNNFKKEINYIKNQIESRNFSGANRMLYNLIKFQVLSFFFKKDFLFLVFYNQFNLLKFRLKKIIFRFICLNR